MSFQVCNCDKRLHSLRNDKTSGWKKCHKDGRGGRIGKGSFPELYQ